MQILLTILVSWTINAYLAQPPAQNDAEAKRFGTTLAKLVELIESEHATPTSQPQLIRWGIEGLYKEMKQPIPADLQARMKTLEKADTKEVHSFLADARHGLKLKKGLENGKDLLICLKAIFLQLEPGGEPRSELIFDPERLQGIITRQSSGGGLIIAADKSTGMLRVVTPIYNGPAYKAGIRAGDIITQIRVDTDSDGQPLKKAMVYSTKGMSVKRANELIFGMAGTAVKLSVIPSANAQN